MATNRTSRSNIASKFEIIQWNPGGFGNRRKRSHLSLFLSSLGSQPAVLALQESGPAPSLSGYCSYVGGTTTCLLVHKAYTAIQIDLDLDLPYDYCMISVLSQRRGQPSIHILNVYCPPRLARASFAHLFHRALRIAARQPLVIVGDFNAPSPHWGYHYEKARGRELKELISSLSLTLLTDPAQPTRSGNSVTRDTCPDLSLTRHIRDATWENLGENLGSDHFLLRISFTPRQKMRQHWGQARLTDWTQFRMQPFPAGLSSTEYAAWASYALHMKQANTRTLATSNLTPAIDPHLLHLWHARRGLIRRWKRNKLNRKLRARIEALTAEAAAYSAQLSDANWADTCSKAANQMSSKSAWRLFRSLLDPSTTRGETQRQLHRVLHAFQGTTDELARELCDRYICRTIDPAGPAYTYSGAPNTDLDAPYTLSDLRFALTKMRRGTAPGRDGITVSLLANLPDQAHLSLLHLINSIWDGSPLPTEWTTSVVTFIPKSAKSVSIEALRPISLTSCAGKLMETMVRERLSAYLEARRTFADTMFGFRPHLSAQDVLLQLQHDIIEPTTMRHNDKAVLALDLRGAFDNVKHSTILTNLSTTNCGQKTFNYIRAFLSHRTAFIRLNSTEHGPYLLGTRGTPQGAVLSPLLFNLAMMNLPSLLSEVEGIQHALYADDITIWTNTGSLAQIEERLQKAALLVDTYAGSCGLECSPAKSALLSVSPLPPPQIFLPSGPVPSVQNIRVLGLHLTSSLDPKGTIAGLRRTSEQVSRMIRRVSTKRGGLRGSQSLRLAHAFVTSRVLYALPYLRLRRRHEHQLDVLLRSVYKRALDLPIATSNSRFAALGVHNTFAEMREAHRVNQINRLSQTPSGRRLLHRLGLNPISDQDPLQPVPELWRQKLWVEPLPRNMNPDLHPGRRLARAAALHTRHSDRPGVFYVDVSGPSPSGHFTAAVITEGKHVDGLSFRADTVTHAEEVAIALAASHPASRTILTDSRSACSQYLQGSIAPLAASLLQAASWRFNPHPIRIVWTPGHSGLPGNEAANAAARASPVRAVAPPCPETESGNTNLTRFREILAYYRASRRLYPDPARGLEKADERLLRRLQTNTFISPAVARHFLPEINGTCSTCHVLADTYHVVASCPVNPVPFSSPFPIPTREAWEEHLLGCSTLAAQRSLVERARAASSSTGVPE